MIRALRMEDTTRSNEEYCTIINNKMSNARGRSMPSGAPKNNVNVISSKVNGLDENKNGYSRWLICVNRSAKTIDSEMRSNNKANTDDETSMEMETCPG